MLYKFTQAMNDVETPIYIELTEIVALEHNTGINPFGMPVFNEEKSTSIFLRGCGKEYRVKESLEEVLTIIEENTKND